MTKLLTGQNTGHHDDQYDECLCGRSGHPVLACVKLLLAELKLGAGF